MAFHSISKRSQKIMHLQICGSFKSVKIIWFANCKSANRKKCVPQIATFAKDPQIYENIF